MTHCWSQNMYFLNLVWLEDPAGSGDRHTVLFVLLSRLPSAFLKLPEYSASALAQKPVQLTRKPLPFWFSLSLSHEKLLIFLFNLPFVPYAGKNCGHKILGGGGEAVVWTMRKGNHKKKEKGKLSDAISIFLFLQMNKIKLWEYALKGILNVDLYIHMGSCDINKLLLLL